MIAKDEIVRLHIKEINQEGLGIGYSDNIPIIVANTLVDEIIDVKIIDFSNRYAIGELLNIIEPSSLELKLLASIFLNVEDVACNIYLIIKNINSAYLNKHYLKYLFLENYIQPNKSNKILDVELASK